ncbi:replication initiation protein [Anaerobacillus sp. 1_MG-2023]|uniref:replication initiation protein n=1 Tax=Anaerobacillus sp. 1_MG-2023 TaxID=3062655 RepID=UPI0026E2A063|nr:replication initiation protein [Anaerobacillus sp. 1_MG-2023]MDO6657402.1 replication initiation protein [Anaerobacillus sp. 1_MG-2023]
MSVDQKHLITKSNALVEANYKLGVLEQKIILMLASKLQPSDTEFKTYSLSVNEFAKLLGISSKSKYEEIRKITYALVKKGFEVRVDNRVHQVSWLSSVTYNENEGTVDLRFDPFLKPYLLELKSHFTSYRLENVIKLKSSYSIRLYELLKQYERVKERTFELSRLREMLGIEDMYPVYGNFKQRVLLRAQEELKDKTDISFKLEEIKKGRKVVKLKFIILQNKTVPKGNHQLSMFDESSGQIIQKLLLDNQIDVSNDVLERWLSSHGKEAVIEVIKYSIERDHVKNKGGYINSVLEKGYNHPEKESEEDNQEEEQVDLELQETKVVAQVKNKFKLKGYRNELLNKSHGIILSEIIKEIEMKFNLDYHGAFKIYKKYEKELDPNNFRKKPLTTY